MNKEAKKEMQDLMDYPPTYYSWLMTLFERPKSYTLEMANNIFVHKNVQTKQIFDFFMKNLFHAGVQKVDFEHASKAAR